MPKREPPIPEGCDATIRTAVLQHLMHALHGDAAASARLVIDAGRVVGLGLVAIGPDRFVLPRQRTQGVPIEDFRLALDTTWSFDQFRSEAADAVPAEVRETFWVQAGMREALGMYVAIDGRFVGYVSVYRAATSPPFSDHDRDIADALAPWVVKAFQAAITVEDTRGMAAGRYLFEPGGALRFQSGAIGDVAKATVGRCADEFLSGARLSESIVGDWRLSMSRLLGADTQAALVEVRPVHSGLVPAVMTLTPIKRRIAAWAARGDTAGEIAKRIGRHPETVRAHLKEIYEILKIGSRVELADLCRGLWTADAEDPEPDQQPKDA